MEENGEREICTGRDSHPGDKMDDGKMKWTQEEDKNLKILVGKFGVNNWDAISTFFPGRTDTQCLHRWRHSVNPELMKNQWIKAEDDKDFKCDVVLQATSAKERKNEHDEKITAPPSLTVESRTPVSTPSPPSSLGSSPGPTSVSAAAPLDQRAFVQATLRMIAEDMLPLSIVEGSGFRSFVRTLCPGSSSLSQRAVGLQLYDDVARTIKPQLIRDLKACHPSTSDGHNIIHVTYDLWARNETKQVEESTVVVQLHFISDSWQIRRPIAAVRRLKGENIKICIAKELEAALLSYGVFPRSIGYVLAHQAKETLMGNRLFCDYETMCAANKAEPDGVEVWSFLSDQMVKTDSPFSKVQTGTRITCVARKLQLVIEEALKQTRVVEDLLLQILDVVIFFRNNSYWTEVLMKESGVSLFPCAGNCRWNSTMAAVRLMVQKSAWSIMMTVLTQARMEATNLASTPPLVMVKREPLADIVALLTPFEEALQVLQGNGVTFSLIIPTLVGVDKSLENSVALCPDFVNTLRTRLCAHFQSLVWEQDVIAAAVLDPRTKLRPFSDTDPDQRVAFLTPPTKPQARAVLEAMLASMSTSSSSSAPEVQAVEESIFNQPPAKIRKLSEVAGYLAEPLCNKKSPVSHWKSAARFPGLQILARKLLAVPATSGGFDRLCPMATCLVRAKRNRLSPQTIERLFLYRNSTKTTRKQSGTSKHKESSASPTPSH